MTPVKNEKVLIRDNSDANKMEVVAFANRTISSEILEILSTIKDLKVEFQDVKSGQTSIKQ